MTPKGKTAPPPKKNGKAAPPKKKQAVKNLFQDPEEFFLPPKVIVVAVEGWGKTSMGAYVQDHKEFNNVAFLMPQTETGYKTLYGMGRVPKVKNLVTHTWKETLEALDSLGDFDALILDELSGFEAQLFESVCKSEYSGNWNKFNSYGRGVKIAIPEWRKFLAQLEALEIFILAFSHCAITTFKDPMNDDHDRYVAALNSNIWGAARRWGDACLFGTFDSIVDDEGKGIGGTERMLYTEHRDTHDAKNRFGMVDEISMPDDPAQMFTTLWDAITNPGSVEPEDEDAEEETE